MCVGAGRGRPSLLGVGVEMGDGWGGRNNFERMKNSPTVVQSLSRV